MAYVWYSPKPMAGKSTTHIDAGQGTLEGACILIKRIRDVKLGGPTECNLDLLTRIYQVPVTTLRYRLT